MCHETGNDRLPLEESEGENGREWILATANPVSIGYLQRGIACGEGV